MIAKTKAAGLYFFSRLSVQLVSAFIVMSIIIIVICFVSLYAGIVNILRSNYENNSVQQFRQYEYNINSFCQDVDLISRQLVIDADLQDLTQYSSLSKSDQVAFASSVLKKFSSIISNYRYVESVIYYGADGLIIKSSDKENLILYNDQSKSDWFYQSKPYQDSKISKQKILWFGGYTDLDFGLSDPSKKNPSPEFDISAVRNMLSGEQTGALVININVQYFSSIYSNSSNTQQGRTYIINDSGKVISSLDAALLGKKADTLQHLDQNKNIQNFTVAGKAGEDQVVYYRLPSFGGILVNEVPVKQITKDIVMLRNILYILFIISLALAFALSRFFVYKLTGPLNKLTRVVKKVGSGNLGLTIEDVPNNELGLLTSQFNSMSVSIKKLFDLSEATEAEKRRLEMEALRAQINPHFIYNTLNTIKWMAVISKEDNIVDSVTTLSDFLEPIFKKHDILCTVNEEISYIRNYVKIMNYRFAGGYKLLIDVPEKYSAYKIIRFVLQPVVENSIVHGLKNKVAGKVSIKMWIEDIVFIEVADDGEGINKSKLKEIMDSLVGTTQANASDDSSIGLANVHRRIKLQFGEEYGLELKSGVGEGTKVLLKMPLVH